MTVPKQNNSKTAIVRAERRKRRQESREPAQRHGVRYPWEKWLANNRKKLKLVRGQDYNILTQSMIVLLRVAARKRKIKLSISTSADQNELTISIIRDE